MWGGTSLAVIVAGNNNIFEILSTQWWYRQAAKYFHDIWYFSHLIVDNKSSYLTTSGTTKINMILKALSKTKMRRVKSDVVILHLIPPDQSQHILRCLLSRGWCEGGRGLSLNIPTLQCWVNIIWSVNNCLICLATILVILRDLLSLASILQPQDI